MSIIIAAVVVSLACFFFGWYIGVEDSKSHVSRRMLEGKVKYLSASEGVDLETLISKIAKGFDSERR